MELVDSIHAQNPPHHGVAGPPPVWREVRDESAKSKEKPPNCTSFVVQFVPWLLTTLLSSENTPSIDYGALAKIQNYHMCFFFQPWSGVESTDPKQVYSES